MPAVCSEHEFEPALANQSEFGTGVGIELEEEPHLVRLTPEQWRRRQWLRAQVTRSMAGLGAFALIATGARLFLA